MSGERNHFFGKTHNSDSLLKMTIANSKGSVYLYNDLKELLVIFPSIKTLANQIHSNSASLVKVINEETLFRGGWYLSMKPFNITDTPVIEDYTLHSTKWVIEAIKKEIGIKKPIFVFMTALEKGNANEFLCRYDGIVQASKALKIRHEIIKKHAESNLPLKLNNNLYIFSFHRILN